MIRAGLMAAAAAFWANAAQAAPMLPGSSMTIESTIVENVKIICEENGNCYRPAGRRPVARFIYGDGAFYGPYYGPYNGPANYGRPNRHYGLTFLGFSL